MITKTELPCDVIYILNTLQSKGYSSFLVGGSVRDLLLGKKPKDFDICTQAIPAEVKQCFPKVIDTGIKYGTVTVITPTVSAEVTTFRKTVNQWDGGRTDELDFSINVEEDVRKRDFTINGLLFDGDQILDYVGGLADLEEKRIRGVENPVSRFQEDGLRMMRAIRFACQLGFDIEPVTWKAMVEHSSWILKVSTERIREEMIRILLSDDPGKGFRFMHQASLLDKVLPELERCYGFDQHNPHHSQDVFEHILNTVGNTPPNLKIRLAALLHDIGKPLTFSLGRNNIGHFYGHELKSYDLAKDILNRLRFDHKTAEAVLALIKEHMNRLSVHGKLLKRSTLKRLVKRVGIQNIDDLLTLQIADKKRPGIADESQNIQMIKNELHRILEEKEPIHIRQLAINGDDLQRIGIEPGVNMGRILNGLLERVINRPELNNRRSLLSIVQKSYLNTGNNGCKVMDE